MVYARLKFLVYIIRELINKRLVKKVNFPVHNPIFNSQNIVDDYGENLIPLSANTVLRKENDTGTNYLESDSYGNFIYNSSKVTGSSQVKYRLCLTKNTSDVDNYKIGLDTTKYRVTLNIGQENLFDKSNLELFDLPEESVKENSINRFRFKTIRNDSSVYVYSNIDKLETSVRYHVIWDNLDNGVKLDRIYLVDGVYSGITNGEVPMTKVSENDYVFVLESLEDVSHLRLEFKNNVEIGNAGFANIVITEDPDLIRNMYNSFKLECSVYENTNTTPVITEMVNCNDSIILDCGQDLASGRRYCEFKLQIQPNTSFNNKKIKIGLYNIGSVSKVMDEIPIENVNVSDKSIFNTTLIDNPSVYGRHFSDVIEINKPRYINSKAPLYLCMDELNFDPTEVIFNAGVLQIEYFENTFFIDNACFTAYEDGRFEPFIIRNWLGRIDDKLVINMELEGRYLKFTTDNPRVNIVLNATDDMVYAAGRLVHSYICNEYRYEAYARQAVEVFKFIDQEQVVDNLGLDYDMIDTSIHIDMIGLNNMNVNELEVFYINECNGNVNIIEGEIYNDPNYNNLGSSVINVRIKDIENIPIGITWLMIVNKHDNGRGQVYMVSEPIKYLVDPMLSGNVIVFEGEKIDETQTSNLIEIENTGIQDTIGTAENGKYKIDVITSNAPCIFE